MSSPPTDHVPPELFEEDVYDHFYSEALEERAELDASLIAAVGELQPGEEVLDAPCGNGRISVQLAKLGHRVVGVDRSERFIAEARARPGAEHVHFEVRDLRELDFELKFDLVLNWFTSFGYFDEEANRGVLRAFRRALRPGGRLILEQRNPALMRRAVAAGGGSTAFIIDKGEDLLADRITFDGKRSHVERFVVRDGRLRRLRFSIEVLEGDALIAALHQAGFADVTLLDEAGDPFTEDSARLLALCATSHTARAS